MLKTIKISLCMLGVAAAALGPVSHVYADKNDQEASKSYQMLNRASFDNYIAMFNAKNPQAFEAYFADDMRMQNGHLVLSGIPAVKEHYHKIWSLMKEELNVVNYVSDGSSLAVEMKTHFTVMHDSDNSPFGKVKKGENFDYHGVIIYKINHMGKFNDIKVAYLDFTRTTDGVTQSLGIVH